MYSTILFGTYVSFSGSKYVSRFTAGGSPSPLSPSHHCSQSLIVHVSNSLCQLESSSFERSSESSRKSRPARAAVSFLGTFTMILEGCRNWSSWSRRRTLTVFLPLILLNASGKNEEKYRNKWDWAFWNIIQLEIVATPSCCRNQNMWQLTVQRLSANFITRQTMSTNTVFSALSQYWWINNQLDTVQRKISYKSETCATH